MARFRILAALAFAASFLVGGIATAQTANGNEPYAGSVTEIPTADGHVYIQVNWPNHKVTTIVACERDLPPWLPAIFNHYCLDYTINGTDVAQTKPFINLATEACTDFVETSQPSVVTDIFGNVAIFAGTGFAYGPIVAALDRVYKPVQTANSVAVSTSEGIGGLGDAITGQGKRNLSVYDCARVLFDKNNPEFGIHPIETVNY
jgi:hypothetical protein